MYTGLTMNQLMIDYRQATNSLYLGLVNVAFSLFTNQNLFFVLMVLCIQTSP